MKSYPSIQSSLGMQYRDIGYAIVFDKLDAELSELKRLAKKHRKIVVDK